MFDRCLLEDLKDFKRGSDNIYELENRYEDIRKIIVNRTKEKINLLRLWLSYKIINDDMYNELIQRVKIDYETSCLYVLGFVTELE